MRKEKALIGLLRGLVDLISEESERNLEFAGRVEALLCDLPDKKTTLAKQKKPKQAEDVPDIYVEWNTRGDTEFLVWLKGQPIPILKAIIRVQDLDPTHKSTRWRKPEKFAEFIAEGLDKRLSRGSAFMRGKSDE
jgi:hypothetical protein